MNRRQRRCLNGTISSPRPLRGQCHEAQRGDIVVSVSRPRLALGAASLQRKDFATFSSKKCPVHFFRSSPTRSLRRRVADCCLARSFYFRFPNKSKTDRHVRRRRHRSVSEAEPPAASPCGSHEWQGEILNVIVLHAESLFIIHHLSPSSLLRRPTPAVSLSSSNTAASFSPSLPFSPLSSLCLQGP